MNNHSDLGINDYCVFGCPKGGNIHTDVSFVIARDEDDAVDEYLEQIDAKREEFNEFVVFLVIQPIYRISS